EVIQGCRLGYQYACRHQKIGHEQYSVCSEVTIDIAFAQYDMMTPDANYCLTPPTELIDYCLQVQAVRERYAKVKWVYEWLYANCRNGASLALYAPWARTMVPPQYQE